MKTKIQLNLNFLAAFQNAAVYQIAKYNMAIVFSAALLFAGCNARPGRPAGNEQQVVRNTWYEDVRPTDIFMSLDGSWKMINATTDRENLWEKPDRDGEDIEVPQMEYAAGGGSQVPRSEDIFINWYSRSFQLEDKIKQALKKGDEIFLHIGGVSWRWSTWLNDQLIVDASYDVFNSTEVNITSILKSDGENTITIAATDNHGLAENLRHARVFEPEVTADRDGDFVAPAPEINSDPIIWGEIELWARPVIRIEDVFIRPDFRNKKLDIDIEVTGQVPTILDIDIVDMEGNPVVIDFAKNKLKPSVQDKIIKTSMSAAWENPRLWEPEDPFLYFAEVSLLNQASGELIDQQRIRFGFRELWIEGGDLMMNGKRLFLARHSMHGCNEQSLSRGGGEGKSLREQMESLVNEWKDLNTINSLRFHRPGYFRPGALASYADELGLMVIPESGFCMGDRFAVNNPLYWENCDKYLESWVKSGRNHPSIVMWSLTNEFIWCGAGRVNPECHNLMYEQEKLVKSLDPTRFVGWDGDWDLPANDQDGPGKSETVNIHYPNESCQRWYPTESWVFSDASMDNPVPVRGHVGKFIWEADSKPIVVGEYAWNNRNYFEGPENMTKYDGDRAYDWEYWITGSLPRKVVKWQTDAWRVQRFAGLNPWTNRAKKHFTLMPLETVILRNDPGVYYSGEKVGLEAYLLNDTQRDREYIISWNLVKAAQGSGGNQESGGRQKSSDSKELFNKEEKIFLVGGDMKQFELDLPMPEVTSPGDFTLRISVEREGKTMNTEEYALRIRPDRKVSWPEGAVLFDPAKTTSSLFSSLGVDPPAISRIDPGLSAASIVLGFYALENMEAGQMKSLEEYVMQGGTVFLMGEKIWPERGLGGPAEFQEGKANHAWIRSEGHPVLKGINDLDLGFWGSEQWVNDYVLLKPYRATGNSWRTLIDVGSREGLQGTVLAEIYSGSGRYLLNLLDFRKAPGEPGARALLGNLLDNLNAPIAPRNAVSLMLPDDHPVAVQLEQSYIRTQAWNAAKTDVPLFVSAGFPDAEPEKIAEWVQSGGVAWLMDLEDNNAGRWEKAMKDGFRMISSDSYDGALIVGNDPLLWGISNEEFFTCQGVWNNGEGSSRGQEPRGSGMSRMSTLARFAIQGGKGSLALLDPAYMVTVDDGKGKWLLSSLDIADGMLNTRKKTGRMLQALFTNFGLESTEVIREVGEFSAISLEAHVNRGFQDDVAGDGKGGWFDQGFLIDLHFFPQNISGFDIANLPMPAPARKDWPAQMAISGVHFNMIDPRGNNGKSCILLSPGDHPAKGLVTGDLSTRIDGIAVNKSFDYLYSLHASGFLEGQADGSVLWTFVLHYSDGSQAEIPVRLNEETADWYKPRELPGATVGWVGPSLKLSPVGLYVAMLENPEPEKEVRSIDIVSAETGSISGIVALTTGRIKH